MLAGDPTRTELAPKAIGSAPFIDSWVLVDTGTAAENIAAIRKTYPDKEYHVTTFPGEYRSCAAGRTLCLTEAQAIGADWIMLLDTDETLELNGLDIVEFLNQTEASVVLVWEAKGGYRKPKFFRTPIKGVWEGDPHEKYSALLNESVTAPKIRFRDAEKSPAQLHANALSILQQLETRVKTEPDNPRVRYYLGDTLRGLEQYDRAVENFLICTALTDWREEMIWCYYLAGWCRLRQGRHFEAARIAAQISAGAEDFPELPWLIALCYFDAGHWEKAIEAATHCASMGGHRERNGWAHPEAWWEAPWELIRDANWNLGRMKEAEQAEREYARLKEERCTNQY
jgi:tetratricopeptide (TPR) repeat protein